MANWEVTKTTRHGKPIEEHTAKVRGGSYKIEADVGSQYGVLYWWDDLRGFGRIESGTIAALKRKAETMPAKDARGLAGLERLANMSRPGEKDMMAKTESFTVRQKDGSSVTYKTDPLTAESLRRLWKLAIDSGASVPQGFNAMLALGINTGKILRASRPGAKATFKVEDRFYFGKGRKERFADDVTYSIAAHVGNEPVGHRSVRSLEEAKAIAKQMLASIKGNAKGKPVLVDVYPVVNGSPKPAVLTLRD